MKDPITLLIGYEKGIKACEVDITDYMDKELAATILAFEAQGRTWGYEFTSKEKMKERRERYE